MKDGPGPMVHQIGGGGGQFGGFGSQHFNPCAGTVLHRSACCAQSSTVFARSLVVPTGSLSTSGPAQRAQGQLQTTLPTSSITGAPPKPLSTARLAVSSDHGNPIEILRSPIACG